QPERLDDLRVEFTRVADHGVTDLQSGATTRVPRGQVVGADGQLHTGRSGNHAGGLDRVRPVGRATFAPPTVLLALAGQHDPDVQRLRGQRCVQRGDLLVA